MRQLTDLFDEHLCGTHDIPLSQITCTALVRPVNLGGVERLKNSIRAKGWLRNHAPAVVLDCHLVPDGQLQPDTFDSVCVRVLDGNHRVSALRELFGADHRVPCRVYWAFDPEISRVVSDGEYTVARIHSRLAL